MQKVLLRTWIQVANSISSDNNQHTKQTLDVNM